MNPALSYIYARLSEPSTWRGIIALERRTIIRFLSKDFTIRWQRRVATFSAA
jgi:hypothetical protein